ncbi:MAG: hypothetical protein JWO43_64 [Candidatus Adlerbacteria bacterium]|nr:hypothetical protein [Candidatus Adlerbacteria bacterium]
MTEDFLKSRGIAYQHTNMRPELRTIVFVHGLSGSLSAWEGYEKLFGNTYNMVTYDLRGHGLSIRPSRSGYALDEHLEDLKALLEHLHISQCVLVSHSFGTLVAMEFARTYPHMLSHKILLAPIHGIQNFAWTRLFVRMGNMVASLIPRLHRDRRTNYSTISIPTPDFSIRRIYKDISNMGLRSYIYVFRAAFAKDYSRDWTELPMPVLIIHGTQDTFVELEHAISLVEKLSGEEFVAIDGANHNIVLNNRERLAVEIKNFVQ